MKCYHCDTELIWGGDSSYSGDEDFDMVTNLSCPKCESFVEVYRAIDKEQRTDNLMRELLDLPRATVNNSKSTSVTTVRTQPDHRGFPF